MQDREWQEEWHPGLLEGIKEHGFCCFTDSVRKTILELLQMSHLQISPVGPQHHQCYVCLMHISLSPCSYLPICSPRAVREIFYRKKNSKIYTEQQKTLKATLRKNKIRDIILPDFDL